MRGTVRHYRDAGVILRKLIKILNSFCICTVVETDVAGHWPMGCDEVKPDRGLARNKEERTTYLSSAVAVSWLVQSPKPMDPFHRL